MRNPKSSFAALMCVLAVGVYAAGTTVGAVPDAARSAIALASGRVSIAGTSNIHPYTASTTDVRIVRVQLADNVGGTDWTNLLKPGAVEAFEIAIPATSLSSPKEGVDKTMHKALKAEEHPQITFRLARLEAGAAPGALRGVGTLEIAGVAREIALDLRTQEGGSTLTVNGEVHLLMTDFGVTPPKAMLGMLKTDPKVTVTFETVLALPPTAATN